ncbi:MAG: sensor histidine kinase [Terriglobales bacterium]
MIERRLQRRVALGFVGAMLLTTSLGFLGWRNKEAANSESDLVVHAYTVINRLEGTLEHVVDAETGARGFALTGQDQFLDPLNSAQVSLVQDLESLRQLTRNDPQQMVWLGPLTNDIRTSVSVSQQIVATRRRAKNDLLPTQSERGKSPVDAIRAAIRAQQDRQTVTLNRQMRETASKREQSDLVIFVSTLVELTLLVLAWMAVSRALFASARARALLKNSNVELERRVAERTFELSAQAQLLAKSSEALRGESRTLQSVLDNMEEGLTAADSAGQFTLWNSAAEKILGTAAKNDLAIKNWAEEYGVYLSDGETLCPTEELPLVRAMAGEPCDAEMFIRNPGCPEGVWVEISARPLKDDLGGIQGGLATFRDISRRKRDEDQIRLLNDDLEQTVARRTAQLEVANKDLEAFTYSVSHDLRAPLRHISGFSRILIEEFAASVPVEASRYLERIAEGARKMGVLLDELLALAWVGRHALSAQSTDLNMLVDDVVSMLAPETEGRLVEWKIANLGSVNCDLALLRQVFQNLIANTLKFTRPRATAIIEIGCMEDHGQSTFFVRDNGVGFDMKYVDKLFGVFQKLHKIEDFEGTGIGLATVRRIIQKHAGRTWAEGELGKGATFYFTINLPIEAVVEANSVTAGVQS